MLVQVKEGHDSTVRPKVETWEFDNGRRYLDAWAADGKPYFSRSIQSRIRVAKVASMIVLPMWCVLCMDTGQDPDNHVFSVPRNAFWNWYMRFVEFDKFDMRKARSVGGPLPEVPVPRPPRKIKVFYDYNAGDVMSPQPGVPTRRPQQ